MGGKQASYTYEQRVAAASAVVDGGATKAEAMAELGIMSLAPLERWCRLYREGGAEALEGRAGARAHPRAGARGALPQARDGDRLPKKKIARPGGAGRSPDQGEGRGRERPARRGARSGAPARPARGSRGPPTTTRCRTRPSRRARSCAGQGRRRSSRAPRTAAATGRRPCACAPSLARALPTRPCSRSCARWGFAAASGARPTTTATTPTRGVVGETFENIVGRDFSGRRARGGRWEPT